MRSHNFIYDSLISKIIRFSIKVFSKPAHLFTLFKYYFFFSLFARFYLIFLIADSVFDRFRAYRTDSIPTIMQIPEIHRLSVNLECWHFHLYVFDVLHQIVSEKEYTRCHTNWSEWENGWFMPSSWSQKKRLDIKQYQIKYT